MKGIDERIDEDVFQRSGHTEKMEKSRNAIRELKEESSSRSSAKNTHWFSKWLLEKKKVWMMGKKGEWCMTGMNFKAYEWEVWGLGRGWTPDLKRWKSWSLIPTAVWRPMRQRFYCDRACNSMRHKGEIFQFL